MDKDERRRRWRLVLGRDSGIEWPTQPQGGDGGDGGDEPIDPDLRRDDLLNELYGGGLEDSNPNRLKWIRDVRKYFPQRVVEVMQDDMIEKDLSILSDPQVLETVVPSVNLVARLLSLQSSMPEETKRTAREVVKKVVEEVKKRLRDRMREEVERAIQKTPLQSRRRRDPLNIPDTIVANINAGNYLPEEGYLVVERTRHIANRSQSLRDIVICVDESGSMISSLVYASIFGAIMASLPAVTLRFVAFDTSVVDLSDQVRDDPVSLLFGATLGGGTDISYALQYCEQLVKRPNETVFILISDLCDGGDWGRSLAFAKRMVDSGVNFITLGALDDSQSSARYDRNAAGQLRALGIPVFCATPDAFPELIAAAINRESLAQWEEKERKDEKD